MTPGSPPRTGAVATSVMVASGVLLPYYCGGTNRRTGHPCRMVLLEAWSKAGAVVKRRCKQCGTWQMIYVVPSPGTIC